jgi:hypothetical protein
MPLRIHGNVCQRGFFGKKVLRKPQANRPKAMIHKEFKPAFAEHLLLDLWLRPS